MVTEERSALLLLFLTSTAQGVYFQPIAYTLPDGLQSVNGSSSTGGCQPESCVMMPIGCDCPGSTPVNGTLIDGVIPSIDTAQEGWASELFVVNRNGQDSFTIGFEFINEPFLRAVELTYFDCGVWGTGLTAVNIHSSPTFPTLTAIATELDLGTLSLSEDIDQNCASLRNIFIAVERPGLFSNYFIEFSLAGTSWRPLNWLHLAEIKFSDVASHSTPETTTTSEMRSSTTLPLVTTTTLPTTTMGAPSATNGDDNAITNATETPNSSRPFEVHSPAPTHNNEDPSTISTVSRAVPVPVFVGSLIGVIALLVLLSVIIVLLCVYIKRSRKRQDTVDRDMEYDDVVEKTTGTTNPIEISMKVNEAYGTHQQENYSAISESSIEACYEELH